MLTIHLNFSLEREKEAYQVNSSLIFVGKAKQGSFIFSFGAAKSKKEYTVHINFFSVKAKRNLSDRKPFSIREQNSILIFGISRRKTNTHII